MRSKRFIPSAALWLTIGLFLNACQTHQKENDTTLTPIPVIRVEDPERSAIEAKNNAVKQELQRVVDFEQDVRLEEVIQYVRKKSDQNIAVDWGELEIVEVERDTPITIRLKGVTLEQLLRITLDQVSSDAFDDDKTGFAIDDGIICISTLRNLREQTYYAVYNVGWYTFPPGLTYQWVYRDNPRAAELLKQVQARREQLERVQRPGFDLNEALSGTSSGGNPIRKRGKDAYEIAEDTTAARLENRINALIELIETTVGDPDEWLDEISTIQPLNDQFVVKTTDKNHRQLELILSALYHSQVAKYRHQCQQMEVFLLLDDAEQYRLKQDYKPAMRKINQALRVDPYSPRALALKQVIKDTLSR